MTASPIPARPPGAAILRVAAVLVVAMAVALAGEATEVDWRAYAAQAAADAAALRFYGFDEGSGSGVGNLAPGGAGALQLVGYGPYGGYQGDPAAPPPPGECPRWSEGRWPWKRAVTCGLAPVQLCRSDYTGDGRPFTVLAWLRPHETAAAESAEGTVLACGPSWKEGWTLGLGNPRWAPDGQAVLRVGVPTGVRILRAAPAAFGVWHLVAVVWDGQEVRLHVDGQVESASIPGPLRPCPPPGPGSGQPAGLLVGTGGLRFDIDELRILARVMPAEEIAGIAARFRPAGTDAEQRLAHRRSRARAAALAAVVLRVPTESGGYFVRGDPIAAEALVPAGTFAVPPATVRISLAARGGGPVAAAESALAMTASGALAARVAVVAPRCGLYDALLTVRDAAGADLLQRAVPIAVVVPPAADPEGRFRLGVGQGAEVHRGAAACGIGWGRVVADWSRIEIRKGEYEWEPIDRAVDAAAAAKLRVLCCPSQFPSWLPGDPAGRMAAYTGFLRLLAARYRHAVGAWEIWNAPMGPPAFAFRAAPAGYVELVGAARRTLAPGGLPILADAAASAVADGIACQDPEDATRPGGGATARPGAAATGAWSIDAGAGALGADRSGRPFTALGFSGVVRWPRVLLPPEDAAVWNARGILARHGAGFATVMLAASPEERQPRPDAEAGLPSLGGVAIAALRAQLAGATAVSDLPLPRSAGVRVLRIERAAAPAVLAVFALERTDAIPLRLRASAPVEGADWLGDPLPVVAPDRDGTVRIVARAQPCYLTSQGSLSLENP